MNKIQELFTQKEDFGNKPITPIDQGWMQRKLNTQEMEYLWKCIDNKRKKDFRNKLAGNISNSYVLSDRGDWFWHNTIDPLIADYEKYFWAIAPNINTRDNNQKHPLHLHQWWVNYQKQTEFNPSHTHTGVYSFVIWMKIPTNYEQQCKLDIARSSNSEYISNFTFSYTTMMGQVTDYTYEMNSDMEGTMLLFPSKLNHQVYPFYNCDEDRISISGNILINTAKNG